MSPLSLVSYADGDISLTEALECDPAVMAELGGPQPREAIADIHARRLAHVASGGWWFKIVPEGSSAGVGTIGIWESEWKGERGHEMGWLVLPAFQGRGLAGAAARLILARARAAGGYGAVHAFPGIANAASNAVCRKCGFERLEECEVDYSGRLLRCNHWRIDLAGGA